MVQTNSQIIQAFPIQANTYTGTPSSFDAKGYKVIHVTSDTQLTFDFGTQGTVVLNASAGQDFAISNAVLYITADVDCWIS